MIMNDIKEKLIHLLGGVTKDEQKLLAKYEYYLGTLRTCDEVLTIMKKAYGMPADQWAKHVYEETEAYYENRKWWNDINKSVLKKWGLL